MKNMLNLFVFKFTLPGVVIANHLHYLQKNSFILSLNKKYTARGFIATRYY